MSIILLYPQDGQQISCFRCLDERFAKTVAFFTNLTVAFPAGVFYNVDTERENLKRFQQEKEIMTMENKELILDDALEAVSGGAGSERHATIVNCKHLVYGRKEPGGEADKSCPAYAGTTHIYYGSRGGWAQLSINCKKRWVSKKYIELED